MWLVDFSTIHPLQSSKKFEDVAQKTNNPDAKVMADTLSTAVGLGFKKGERSKGVQGELLRSSYEWGDFCWAPVNG